MTFQQLSLIILLLIAGMGIPIMAALNSDLGARIANPWLATFILCGFATLLTAAIVLTRGVPKWHTIQAIPMSHWFTGAIFVLYISSITYATPHIGLGYAVVLILFGQLVSSTIIDHFGLFNVPIYPVTGKRILGLGLMFVGIYLAKKDLLT